MLSLSKINLELSELPKDKAVRTRLFAKLSRKEVAGQIRLLRERRRFTQIQFAKLCKMKQSAVSRIEQAEYSGWTYKILARIADKCDARLRIIFVPAEDLVAQMKIENAGSQIGGSATGGSLFRAEVPESVHVDQERTPSLETLAALVLQAIRTDRSWLPLDHAARRQFPEPLNFFGQGAEH